jgi:signal transduction histidine kinase
VQKEQFEVIYHSGEFLLSLITDILEFSKIESGKLEIESKSFDIGLVIDNVVESLAPAVFAKGLDFHLQVCPRLSSRLVGDETRIKQILINLIGNAIKFTPKKAVVSRSITLLTASLSPCAATGTAVPSKTSIVSISGYVFIMRYGLVAVEM